MDRQKTFLCWMKATSLRGLLVLSLVILPSVAVFAADTSSDVDVCEEPAIQQAITRNIEARTVDVVQTGQEAFKSRMKQFQKNPRQIHVNIGDGMCIKNLLLKQKAIADKVGDNSLIKDFLRDMLLDLTDQVCEYVSSNIDTALNNALNLMCIPVPDLGYFTLELPSLERTSCDGVSLSDYMAFTPVQTGSFSSSLPSSYVSAPFMRSIVDVKSGSSVGVTTGGW